MTIFLPHPFFLAAAAEHGEQRATIFFAQVLLLIAVGRLLGECMQRIGQPAVIGQLLAGIILGPSVFGAIWPAAQQAIFPPNSSDRQMLNAVSDIGVLLLLLLTGMETDLALVKRVRRTAAITSAAGIVIPLAAAMCSDRCCRTAFCLIRIGACSRRSSSQQRCPFPPSKSVLVQYLLEQVMQRHLVLLAAFFVQSQPSEGAIVIVIIDPEFQYCADTGEACRASRQ